MTDNTPAKRGRGAQPGNQNAKGNRGNSRPRRNVGNRGGKGAPRGNQYTRKRPRGLAAMLLEYRNDSEAREWIEANRDVLESLTEDDSGTDAVDIAIHTRLTPECITERGREFELGLFTKPELESERRLAA
jgi:hypothetical protein